MFRRIKMKINLKVNGKRFELEVPPSKRLLDVIREDLGLTGTKYGCGTGECGACTILLDGKPVPSCIMLAAQANNQEITTIEGVQTHPLFKKIEEAFIAKGAVQCGYCTPAMVLTTLYLLEKKPKATREEIEELISGVYCRCGCYQKVIDAIELIVKGEKAQFASSAHSHIVGERIGRIDLKDKIRGKAIYAIDLKPFAMWRFKDLLYLKFLRSPYPFAKIKSINLKEAEALEGVELVLTYKNVPRVKFTTAGQAYPEPSPYDTRVLNNPVRYVGEPVAVVAARNEEIAEDALKLIKVEYEPLEPVFDPDEAMKPNAPKIHPKGNLIAELHKRIGNINQGFKKAEVRLEREYETQIQKHIHLEPYACLTHWELGKLVVETSSQVVFHCRRILSHILNLPMGKLRVRSWTIGGGFGDKQELTLEHYAALITLKTRKPVWASLTREEQFYLSRRRHSAKVKIKLGAKRSGEFTAISMEALSDTGAYGAHGITVTTNIGGMTLPLYTKNCKSLAFDAKVVYTNKPIAGALRGYGTPQGAFPLECAIDELAECLKIDPIDLRLKNLISEGDIDPVFEVLSEGGKAAPRRINSCQLAKALEEGRKLFDWNKKKGKGIGVACGMKGSGVAGFELSASLARLNEDGTVTLTMGASDIGQGAESAIAQIGAQAIGTKLEDVEVIAADTDRTLFDMGTYASSVTYVTGEAVRRAGINLKKKILKHAAKLMGRRTKDLDIKDGEVYVKEEPNDFVTLKEVAMKAVYGSKKEQLVGIGNAEDLTSPPPFTAHFVEVKVDEQTGQVKIVRYLNLTDIGTVINPTAAEGQLEGSIAQGIGYALFEEVKLDKQGNILNPDLTNYKIPSALDLPKIETRFIKTYEPTGPFGAKSAGEICLAPVAPAIANAIYDAIGVRFRELPITKEKIAMMRQKPKCLKY
jgi:putative selenate reductase molybdopterin-binding subunit